MNLILNFECQKKIFATSSDSHHRGNESVLFSDLKEFDYADSNETFFRSYLLKLLFTNFFIISFKIFLLIFNFYSNKLLKLIIF